MFDRLLKKRFRWNFQLIKAPPSPVSTMEASQSTTSQDGDDSSVERHWATALVEIACVPECHCNWCKVQSIAMDSQSSEATPNPDGIPLVDDLPSTRSIMEILYPPSLPGSPNHSTFEIDCPPAYEAYTPKFQGRHDSGNIFSTEISLPEVPTPARTITPTSRRASRRVYFVEDISPSERRSPPRCQTPYYPRSPRPGISSAESHHSFSFLNLDDTSEIQIDSSSLPPYTRFDPSRPRFPSAFDILHP